MFIPVPISPYADYDIEQIELRMSQLSDLNTMVITPGGTFMDPTGGGVTEDLFRPCLFGLCVCLCVEKKKNDCLFVCVCVCVQNQI